MVLDDLYCGNIYPAEQVVPHEKEYRKLYRHTGELLTELEEKLSKEQMDLVNQFHAHVLHDGKRKKPSYSRPFDTPIGSGGFDFQSRRFFLFILNQRRPEHRVKARRQIGGCRRVCSTISQHP